MSNEKIIYIKKIDEINWMARYGSLKAYGTSAKSAIGNLIFTEGIFLNICVEYEKVDTSYIMSKVKE